MNSQQYHCNLLCVSLCLALSQTLLAAHGFLSLTIHKQTLSNLFLFFRPLGYSIYYPIPTPFPVKLVYQQVLGTQFKMKVLSWINRKSRQDNTKPLKKISIGNSCFCLSAQPSFDEQQYHSEPRFASAANPKQTKRECSKYLNGLTSKEDDVFIEEPATMMSELFQGFLTIGTLGSEPSIAEPTTPKFARSCQSVNEKETEVTVTKLMLIHDELDRFLEAEAKAVDYDSSERSSFVSTITLSNYQTEVNDAEENKNMVACPLQQYLFSSSIECPKTGEMKKEKGSLGMLFANDYKNYEQQNEEEKTATIGTRAVEFMKKMLNKIHVTSRSSKASANDHAVVTVSTKRKLSKVLRLLQRRIHPDISVSGQNMVKSRKCEDRTKIQARGATVLEKGSHKFPKTMLKDKVKKVIINQESLDRNHSTGNGEHWIKTDTDYLVLELYRAIQ